jgi:hypothetical protein
MLLSSTKQIFATNIEKRPKYYILNLYVSNFYLKGSHVIHKTLWQRSGNVLQHLQEMVKKHIQ